MYTPKAFQMEDKETLYRFIQSNSLGIVVTNKDHSFSASHLPLQFDESGQKLTGHMARSNQQSEHGNSEVLVIFHGPQAYISPTWFNAKEAVPTWNYTAVHVYGTLTFTQDQASLQKMLKHAVDSYEHGRDHPWTSDLQDSYNQKLMEAIVGFEITIHRMEGKWKLSQNQTLERQLKIIEGLKSEGTPNALEVAELMQTNISNKKLPSE